MPFRTFGAFYSRSFAARPWLTLAVTNGGLSVVADSLAQLFQHANSNSNSSISSNSNSDLDLATAAKSFDYDTQRGARFLAFGAGMAPLLAEWNKVIETKFPLRPTPPSPVALAEAAKLSGGATAAVTATASAAAKSAAKVSAVALAKRVAFDQGIFAPFGLVLFVGFMSFAEGRSIQGVQDKFKEVYWPALQANWQVWPAVQAINFRFMPLQYRVPFVSSCGILWTLYLSLLSSSQRSRAREQVEVVA